MPKKGNWDGKSRGGRVGYSIFVFCIKNFGLGAAYFMLAFVVPYFIIFAPKATQASWYYHRHILHRGIFASAFGIYGHLFSFGQAIIDRLAIKAGLADKFEFIYNDSKRAEELSRLNGAILVSAHVGSWEIAGNFFGEKGMKVNVVMFDDENKDVKDVVQKVKKDLPYTPIIVNDDPLNAMLAIKVALNNGEFVCIDGERYVDENSAVDRQFMGEYIKLPQGPYRIAAKCHVPVIFFYAMREKGRRYRLIVEEAPEETLKNADSISYCFLDSLERIVRNYPHQWFNFYDYWKSQK